MKEITLNEYRQTKEYYMEPVKRIMAQQIDEELEREDPSKYGGDVPEEIQKIQEELEYKEWANQANKSEQMKENRDEKIWRDLEQTKCSIAEKILKHFDDTLFEMVCKEMGNNFLFQSDNYLTEAGMDEFEDAWFEFYHEHHGDILHQVRQSLAN